MCLPCGLIPFFISHLLTNSSPPFFFPTFLFFLNIYFLFFIFFGFLFFNQISRGLGDDRQLYCLNILIIGDYVLLSTFSSFAFPFVYIYFVQILNELRHVLNNLLFFTLIDEFKKIILIL